jgi:hypothetical protein
MRDVWLAQAHCMRDWYVSSWTTIYPQWAGPTYYQEFISWFISIASIPQEFSLGWV